MYNKILQLKTHQKQPKQAFDMKKLFFLCLAVTFLSGTTVASDPEPVPIRTGETFNFNTFHNYGWGCSSNLFKDSEGKLHAAYVDNFKLYYLTSADQGETWETEQVITGFEGKIWLSGIVVNSEGKVFIPFAMHPNYNYGQSALGSSQFIYKVYCAILSGEAWDFVLLQDNIPGSNQGHRLGDVLIDAEDRVHVFTERYGWYTYGGSLYESIYDPNTETWDTQAIVVYSDTPIDNFSLLTKAAINSDGDIAIMFWRHYFNRWQYAIKPFGEEWQTPQIFDSNPTFRQFSLAAGPDGDFHIVWVKGSDPFTLHYQHGFEEPEPVSLYTGATGELLTPVIHADQAGKLTLAISRNIPNLNLIKIKPSAEEDWATDLMELPFPETVSGLYNVKLMQGFHSHYQTLFFKYIRQGSNGPHGPDQVYFWQMYNLKELTLEANPPEGGSVSGEGFYNIDSPVTITAEPEDGFIFLGWLDEDENTFSDEPSFDFLMPYYNLSLVAKFQSTVTIKEPMKPSFLEVFPNPSKGNFRVIIAEEAIYSIIDLTGRIICSGQLSIGNNQIDLTGHKPGLYFLSVIGRDQKFTRRIVIN